MDKMKRLICAVFACVLGFLIAGDNQVGAKMKWEYKGIRIASSYTAASNTPSGTHQTYSGHRATEGRTIAVDDRNPIASMGQKVKLKWKVGKKWHSHIYRVEDKGHFGHYNNGMRAIDVFFEYRGWGLRKVKVYVLRPETKKERKERLRKVRLRRERALRKWKRRKQRETFIFKYDPSLFFWQVVTDKKIISGGVIRAGLMWLDVVKTEKGLGNIIYCGDRSCMFGKQAKLVDVVENAVG